MISQNPGPRTQPMNRPQTGRYPPMGPRQPIPGYGPQPLGRPPMGPREGFPPSRFPVMPLRPAPARMGIAGISAGEDRFYKTHVNIPPERGIAAAPDHLAKFLGYFSLGLGLAEVAAGGALAEWLGMDERALLLRLYGIREIGVGAGILTQPGARATWVWARVAGDALDLLTLATGLRPDNPKRGNVATAMMTVGGVTAVDILCAAALTARR